MLGRSSAYSWIRRHKKVVTYPDWQISWVGDGREVGSACQLFLFAVFDGLDVLVAANRASEGDGCGCGCHCGELVVFVQNKIKSQLGERVFLLYTNMGIRHDDHLLRHLTR